MCEFQFNRKMGRFISTPKGDPGMSIRLMLSALLSTVVCITVRTVAGACKHRSRFFSYKVALIPAYRCITRRRGFFVSTTMQCFHSFAIIFDMENDEKGFANFGVQLQFIINYSRVALGINALLQWIFI